MKLIRFIAVLMMLFGIICFIIGYGLAEQVSVQAQSEASAFDSSGWGYRRLFTVNGSPDGAQTNYQKALRIYRSTGTDGTEALGSFTAGKVYLSTKCEADYDDIRITKSDGTTLLDYWIEESDSSDATIWIEVDSIPAHPDDFSGYIYYGKAGATAVSSSDNTFPFADEFNRADSSTVGNGWVEENDVWSVVSNTLTGAPLTLEGANRIHHSYTWSGKKIVECRSKSNTTSDYGLQLQPERSDMRQGQLILYKDGWIKYLVAGAGWASTGISYSVDTYYILGIMFDVDADTSNHYVDRVKKTTGVDNDAGDWPNCVVMSNLGLARSNTDWVLIRSFTANEPTWGTWGNEEQLGGNDKLSGIQIGLLSFGLVLMLCGVVILVKGRAKKLLGEAVTAVGKVKGISTAKKGIIILVVGAVVVIAAIVIIVV